MAQQSVRRDRENQIDPKYVEYASLIWTRSANSHAGRRSKGRTRGRTDGSIRLRVTAILKFSLALKGASTDVAWIILFRFNGLCCARDRIFCSNSAISENFSAIASESHSAG